MKIVIFLVCIFTLQVNVCSSQWNLIQTYDFNTTNVSNELVDWHYGAIDGFPDCFQSICAWQSQDPLHSMHSSSVNENSYYSPNAVTTGNLVTSSLGPRYCLNITATYNPWTYNGNACSCTIPFQYESGWIETGPASQGYPFEEFGYGKYEISCKLPIGKGLNPAFWLWGPGGEIDVFETLGFNSSNYPQAGYQDILSALDMNFHHYDNPHYSSGILFDNQNDTYSNQMDVIDYSQEFHTYAVEWTPDYIKWLVDDKVRRIVSCDQYPSNFPIGLNSPFPAGPLRLVVDLSVLGTNAFPSGPSDTPATFFVDWIKIYAADKCESYVVCDNDPNESPNFTNLLEGYNIDLAVDFDVDYNHSWKDCDNTPVSLNESAYEKDWCCAGQSFPLSANNSQNDFSCSLNVYNGVTYHVKAENLVTLHQGFLADLGSDFIAEINPCQSHRSIGSNSTSVKNIISDLDLSIVPNPSNGLTQLYFNKTIKENGTVSFKNVLGKEVFLITVRPGQLKHQFDAELLAAGVYFVTLDLGQERITKRFVKN